MGYLHKCPKKGYYINPTDPSTPQEYTTVAIREDFGYQCSYFKEDIDPRFPVPLSEEMAITMFVDADHGHDKVTGRSITGFICMVGSTPVCDVAVCPLSVVVE